MTEEIDIFNLLFAGKHNVKRWQIVKNKKLDTNLLEHQYLAFVLYNDFCMKKRKEKPLKEIVEAILFHDIGEIRKFNRKDELESLKEFARKNDIVLDQEIIDFVNNNMSNCDFPFQMKKQYPYLKRYCDEKEHQFVNSLSLNVDIENLEYKDEVKKADILANLFDIKEEIELQGSKDKIDEEFLKGIDRLFNMKQVVEDKDLKEYMENFLKTKTFN